MDVTIPLYIEQHAADGGPKQFRATPLFVPWLSQRHVQLDQALAKLARDLRRYLDQLGREPRHDAIVRWTFNPPISEQMLELDIELRQSRALCRFLAVGFNALGRNLVYIPGPEVWLELPQGASLRDRVQEVLVAHYRRLEREDLLTEPPISHSIRGRAWVSALEMSLSFSQRLKPDEGRQLASLFGGEQADGARELEKVGRCLSWTSPEELMNALLRDGELAELSRLVTAPDRRPVLLVGPRAAGKTALVHALVRRTIQKGRTNYGSDRNLWLLSPQRLISGMAYVGQWEDRLIAILKEAAKRSHILYFDDLPGLFQAGRSRSSDLSAGQVVKHWIERRDVRVLAEITPEALRVLREVDRGFADLFHVIPVRETNDAETLRILIHVQREVEGRYGCRFDLEVIPTVLSLQRRYARDQAFPGKATAVLEQLALKLQGAGIGRLDVIQALHARTGLSMSFLDDQTQLERETVVRSIGERMIGQREAVAAMADVVGIGKARLNDPGRPLASFLFLGPTGVGKTQAARALAGALFGDTERMLRFDMNEFVSPYAVSRLVGTFNEPDGLLTSAIRRQPFAVVLLDEIEKAHPDVFNLLLQVMGEGRLTDALGRPADFTNAILILTSNLGARESSSRMGFGSEAQDGKAIFTRAAEAFFAPEFFNRIDRIVPFARLTREEVRQIARLQLDSLVARDGLARRRCALEVEPRALEWLVDQGYHPVLGARALKRALEGQLTRRIAAKLAAAPTGRHAVLRIFRGPEGPLAALQTFEDTPAAPRLELRGDLRSSLERLGALLEALERDTFRADPVAEGGSSAPVAATARADENDDPDHDPWMDHYDLQALRERYEALEEALTPEHLSPIAPRASRGLRRSKKITWRWVRDFKASQVYAAEDLESALVDLYKRGAPLEQRTGEMLALAREIHHERRRAAAPRSQRALLLVRPFDEAGVRWCEELFHVLTAAIPSANGYTVALTGASPRPIALKDGKAPPVDAHRLLAQEDVYLIEVGGKGTTFAAREVGVHLFVHDGRATPVQVADLPIGKGETPLDVAAAWRTRRENWLAAVERGEASVDDDPSPPGAVVRIYGPGNGLCDLRSGMTLPSGEGTIAEWSQRVKSLVWETLPLPPELVEG